MILVKADRINSKKCKVRKFDLISQFGLHSQLDFVDPKKIPANTLFKISKDNVEKLNKRLERCRLVARAIECSFNNNYDKLIPKTAIAYNKGKVKGKLITISQTESGIFIH